MARGNYYSVQQVLQLLQTDQLDDSCDEEEENELQDEDFISTYVAADELSDSDTDNDKETPASSSTATLDTPSGSNNNTSAIPEIPGQLRARNGTLWKNITSATAGGRACAANVFSERPGPTSYCQRYIEHGSPYSDFQLFIDEHILKCVQKHSINYGKNDDSDFNLHLDELESFIGLQLARGLLVGRNTPVKQLWSKDWEQAMFRNTISRDRYAKIMKHLRFDDFHRRRQSRETDKFCLISEVWNSFRRNCKKYYVPNFHLTIDEQLFPCKTRCPFI